MTSFFWLVSKNQIIIISLLIYFLFFCIYFIFLARVGDLECVLRTRSTAILILISLFTWYNLNLNFCDGCITIFHSLHITVDACHFDIFWIAHAEYIHVYILWIYKHMYKYYNVTTRDRISISDQVRSSTCFANLHFSFSSSWVYFFPLFILVTLLSSKCVFSFLYTFNTW